jgi:blue copper oxidase
MMSIKRHYLLALSIAFGIFNCNAQNSLYIPPALTGTTFNLNIQSGTQAFYSGKNTPTYGINGVWMAPTIIVNKGDIVNLNVHNGLNSFTTIHWHGLHIAPQNDGGPHQIINVGATWSPIFQVKNDAGTYWYHPHGANKTDLHVSKGLAGMFIVRDTVEAALTLPRTYGKDDFPIIVQSKAFDVLQQIAIATDMDTALFVNGTLYPYLNTPAQVVRLRLLNGSSMRTYNFGFTANKSFKMIASDGGLLDSAITLTRIRLSPGERAEVLLDLQSMNGQTIYLKNYGSELPAGIYGAKKVGTSTDTIPEYSTNKLNGADYDILKLTVVASTAGAVTTMPIALAKLIKWNPTSANLTRTFHLNADSINHKAEGPFSIDGHKFSMDTINVTTYKNNIEIWKWVNHTLVAHPIHIHGMHFYILDIDGTPPPAFERGKKDVVLIQPGDSVRFITQFEDFADKTIPYMYHCHLLHHEDDGMMGSFLVLDTTATGIAEIKNKQNDIEIYPNPASFQINIKFKQQNKASFTIYNTLGRPIKNYTDCVLQNGCTIDVGDWPQGVYFIKSDYPNLNTTFIITR